MKWSAILALVCLSPVALAQQGTVANAGVMEWLGGVLTGADQCVSASAVELQKINHGSGGTGELDARVEEATFNKAADTARGAARCLETTLASFVSTPATRDAVLLELNHVWPSVGREMAVIKDLIDEKNQAIARTYADRINPHPRRPGLQREASSLDLLLTLAAGKLPFGEDPKMQRFYKRHAGKTLSQLRPLFDRELRELQDLAEDSARRFDEKLAAATPPRTYRLGHADKRDLALAYYPQMVNAYGGDALMREGLLCRLDKRYLAGPERISMITDVGLAGVSIATLGVGSVVGGAATLARGALIVRGAHLAGALVGVAGTARAMNLTHQACREAAETANFLVGSQCTIDNALQAQRLKSAQSACAFEAALAAVNVVGVAGNIRALVAAQRGATSSILPRTVMGLQAVIAEVRRIPGIARKLDEGRAIILNSNPVRRTRIDATILDAVVDTDLKRGFRAALNQLQDKDRIANYFEQLQADTFRRMLYSGNPIKVAQARAGQLNPEDLMLVLRGRAAEQGIDVVVIKQSLNQEAFNAEIGKGFIIDEGFSMASRHGTWTHFIQQDMVYGLIARVANKRPQDVVRFFGTPNGMNVWNLMFDGGSLNALRPEWFKNYMMRPLIPLGKCIYRIKESSLVA